MKEETTRSTLLDERSRLLTICFTVILDYYKGRQNFNAEQSSDTPEYCQTVFILGHLR